MTTAREAAHGQHLVQVGAYFHAARTSAITRVPACELTGRIVAVEDLWESAAGAVEAAIHQAAGDSERVSCLERALLERVGDRGGSRGTVDLASLAASVNAQPCQCTVGGLAQAAGVSRQHLAKLFREGVGVTPKLYCRLARFQAVLPYANRGRNADWARVAVEMGYTDQSHMIAEFREFTGLTPASLALQPSFHPFMGSGDQPLTRDRYWQKH